MPQAGLLCDHYPDNLVHGFCHGLVRRIGVEQLQRCCFVELAFELPYGHQALPTTIPEPDVRIQQSGLLASVHLLPSRKASIDVSMPMRMQDL